MTLFIQHLEDHRYLLLHEGEDAAVSDDDVPLRQTLVHGGPQGPTQLRIDSKQLRLCQPISAAIDELQNLGLVGTLFI